MRRLIVCLAGLLAISGLSHAQTPPEVLKHYKAYRAALDKDDAKAAKKSALEAWELAEELLGDHKTTGDLAMNYASIQPTGGEKNPYKNYKTRVKAYKRAIELSRYYGNSAKEIEIQRRIDLVGLEMTLRRVRSIRAVSIDTVIGSRNSAETLIEKIDEYGMSGTTFDADAHALLALFYEQNGRYDDAVKTSEKAIALFENRNDNYFSPYEYQIRLIKGNSHYKSAEKSNDFDEKISAALEYQVVMQNLEGKIPVEHPFIGSAFRSWLRARSDIEEAGLLEKAESAGLCECWPYENYKSKPQPLLRVPPIMPRNARRSGHVYVSFDLEDNGSPSNIKVVSSSSPIFEKSAIASVEKWEYSKMTSDMTPESRQGISTKITFRLTNSKGSIIPE